jgi:hypothetical protein
VSPDCGKGRAAICADATDVQISLACTACGSRMSFMKEDDGNFVGGVAGEFYRNTYPEYPGAECGRIQAGMVVEEDHRSDHREDGRHF